MKTNRKNKKKLCSTKKPWSDDKCDYVQIDMYHPIIKGLFYQSNVLTKEEQKDLIQKLDQEIWHVVDSNQTTQVPMKDKDRIVQQYGWYFDYTTYTCSKPAPAFPLAIKELAVLSTTICKKQLGSMEPRFNAVIVNNYFPNQGISPHIDAPCFGPIIACVNVGSGATITFTRETKKSEIQQAKTESIDVYMEPGSIYVMTEEARYEWKHEMKHVLHDMVEKDVIPRQRRISVTFRQVSC